MSNFQDSFLSGGNIAFIEGLYARYLEDPASVDPSWREIFEGNEGGRPIYVKGEAPQAPAAARTDVVPKGLQASAAGHPEVVSSQSMGLQFKVDQAVYAFRLRGHLRAQLDPLGRPRPPLSHVADLALTQGNYFSEEELRQTVDSAEVFPQKRVELRALIDRLRETYSHHVGVEFMTLLDSDRRRWLMPRMEHAANHTVFSVEEQRRILTKLAYAEGFEQFLHTKYVGVKRFSLEGGESLIPMLDAFLETGAEHGMREVVFGMAHRGRLNVLTNILGKSLDEVFSEFEGGYDPKTLMHRGDVKYHQGFSSDYTTQSGKKVHLSLAFNPSHLEAVDPVVLGRVRAKQDRFKDTERYGVVPVLIHGDAAFIGQGVVAETLNLSRLKGYDVGGTIHIVINNQVGFTTNPSDARSTIYSTAIAQMLDIPIFHVNGDDPEACVHVMRLATEYRQKFKSDVVIDLLCYRKLGHNEGDEPAFTQPEMYALIRKHASPRQQYADALVVQKRLSAEETATIQRETAEDFSEAQARAKEKSRFREPSAMGGLWKSYRGGPDREVPQVETGVPKDELTRLLRQLNELPAGFKAHPTLERSLLANRLKMADGQLPLDWSAGENLAYATLLSKGTSIRLTGQDVERGTFTHRHAVLNDATNGQRHVPLQHLGKDQGEFRIYNSPLSEMGCLGFEFGYSLDCPDCLIVWEAQFGDFANGAQVIIDQFMVAAERKWSRLTGLTLLLPHGYEGQGPEHSSARLERFLELSADDNIQVCYPTTAAQIFHLLRRQVMRPIRKPLVVMSPKSLLRKPEVGSSLEDLSKGSFQRVIADPSKPKDVTRLLLCSGKVYYDLAAEREARGDSTVAIARLEQLHPFPEQELLELIASKPKLKEIYWVQEEPKNMGAWRYIFPLLNELVLPQVKNVTLGYVGRVEAASPATGFTKAHELEQRMIVEQALSRGSR
ncbi:MAG: 2-oxoglutarate dehydrogenase E1 component [Myxococcota bacterium]|nr:2-oxoglutarate dehydrogenase E1 component [Myxococcota bacterium]